VGSLITEPANKTGYRGLWRRNPSWRSLVVSIAVSTPGDLLYSIALGRRTLPAHGRRSLDGVAIVAPLGRMVLAPLGGDMADRFDRNRIVFA
jgi:murein DD-endopeptidase MepM/ murein hydrolase activator NlpD